MTSPHDLRAEAERRRMAGSRFEGERRIPMQLLADRLDAKGIVK
jgi:hypothetical protein